jgi:O-glycosyl hydrolase
MRIKTGWRGPTGGWGGRAAAASLVLAVWVIIPLTAARAEARPVTGTSGRPPAPATTTTGARPSRRPTAPEAGARPRVSDPSGTESARLQVGPAEQEIDGFGASGAWWPSFAGHFGAASQQELADLLFTPKGMDLSQYRYNIGGGGVGVKVGYKAPPTFLRPTGGYDWGADPAGMTFLKLAAQDHVSTLIGFVNSAPAVFTTDHKSCGGALAVDEVGPYASYLTAVAAHLQTEHLHLGYLSPMNEPDASQDTCSQEGMMVPVGERAELVNDLARDLHDAGLSTQVIADESSLDSQLLTELPHWLPQARQSVAVVAHHGYDYPGPAVLEQVGDLAVKHWSTEICCWNGRGFGYQYDPTMDSGLWLADTIWNDLVIGRDSAFQWWLAASPNMGCDPDSDPTCPSEVNSTGRNDGLVYFDPDTPAGVAQHFYLTKRYWVMAAFSRYVRPGSILHQVSGLPPGLRAVAFQEARRWVLEVVNDSERTYSRLALETPTAGPTSAHAYLTDADHNLAPLPVTENGGDPTINLAPRSLSTVVLFSLATTPSRHTLSDHTLSDHTLSDHTLSDRPSPRRAVGYSGA